MTPEQKARELIDEQLDETGWAVQLAGEMGNVLFEGGAGETVRSNLLRWNSTLRLCYSQDRCPI